MRIGVDIRSLASGQGRGVSHYTAALVAELARRHPNDTWILLQTGRRPFALPSPLQLPNVQLVHQRTPNKLLNLTIGLFGQPPLDELAGEVDVFFAPNLGFVTVAEAPLVVTVHDLSFALHSRFFSWRERLWHRLIRPRRLLRQAARIIAVSDQTRQEIAKVYGLQQVTTVHSGIDPVRRPAATARQAVATRLDLPERYFLFIGAAEPRKNIEGMLAAFTAARQRGLRAELVLAGPRSDARTWPAGVRALGYVEEADKAALYAGATALVLLSHHEGFGFPPLEALAAGTPAVVSDRPVFRETLGPAAVIVPDDAQAVAEKLLQLEGEPKLRADIMKHAPAVLDRLTWRQAAHQTYQVLQEAVADA